MDVDESQLRYLANEYIVPTIYGVLRSRQKEIDEDPTNRAFQKSVFIDLSDEYHKAFADACQSLEECKKQYELLKSLNINTNSLEENFDAMLAGAVSLEINKRDGEYWNLAYAEFSNHSFKFKLAPLPFFALKAELKDHAIKFEEDTLRSDTINISLPHSDDILQIYSNSGNVQISLGEPHDVLDRTIVATLLDQEQLDFVQNVLRVIRPFMKSRED